MEAKLAKKQTEYSEIPTLPELVVRPQTVDEEYDRVRFYLNKLPWYTENGYKLILPDNAAFQQLTQPEADLT